MPLITCGHLPGVHPWGPRRIRFDQPRLDFVAQRFHPFILRLVQKRSDQVLTLLAMQKHIQAMEREICHLTSAKASHMRWRCNSDTEADDLLGIDLR